MQHKLKSQKTFFTKLVKKLENVLVAVQGYLSKYILLLINRVKSIGILRVSR